MTDIIDFDAEKDRRVEKNIDNDQETWGNFVMSVLTLLREQDASAACTASAAFVALFDFLTNEGGMSPQEAATYLIERSRYSADRIEDA